MAIKSIMCVVCATTFSVNIYAAPILWTLNDVRFDDGAMANGSFIYDATSNIYSDVSIITDIGGDFFLDSVEYGANASTGSNSHIFIKTEAGSCAEMFGICERTITLSFLGPFGITDDGGIVSLSFGDSNEFSRSTLSGNSDIRFITSGSVSAVPIPAAIWLFGSGLLGLVGVARSKRKKYT